MQITSPSGTASMYVCGVTPYDATHLGHAATYLAFDLIHRVWLDLGHHVDYVQNITDVDDPLLERAARDHQDWRALAARETALFREDMSFLRILPPRHRVGAVEAMAQIIDMIADLVAAGVAYRDDRSPHPDVYFDVDAGGPLGVVSGYETSVMLRLAAEGDGESRHPGRRRVLDPVIWRAHRDGEPAWESALGPGPRLPSPRLQCSARRGAVRGTSLRRVLDAHRDGGTRRGEDVEVARQPGPGLEPARPWRRRGSRPPRPPRRPLPV
jgi:L-cysteine:1D-myo-inositol 2-amino-2-deoxy-alpha-D-glucopyranoside ligase